MYTIEDIFISDYNNMRLVIQRLSKRAVKDNLMLAIDTENTGLDPYRAQPLLFAMSVRGGEEIENYVFDMTSSTEKKFQLIKPLLENPSILKLGHNLHMIGRSFISMVLW